MAALPLPTPSPTSTATPPYLSPLSLCIGLAWLGVVVYLARWYLFKGGGGDEKDSDNDASSSGGGSRSRKSRNRASAKDKRGTRDGTSDPSAAVPATNGVTAFLRRVQPTALLMMLTVLLSLGLFVFSGKLSVPTPSLQPSAMSTPLTLTNKRLSLREGDASRGGDNLDEIFNGLGNLRKQYNSGEGPTIAPASPTRTAAVAKSGVAVPVSVAASTADVDAGEDGGSKLDQRLSDIRQQREAAVANAIARVSFSPSASSLLSGYAFEFEQCLSPLDSSKGSSGGLLCSHQPSTFSLLAHNIALWQALTTQMSRGRSELSSSVTEKKNRAALSLSTSLQIARPSALILDDRSPPLWSLSASSSAAAQQHLEQRLHTLMSGLPPDLAAFVAKTHTLGSKCWLPAMVADVSAAGQSVGPADATPKVHQSLRQQQQQFSRLVCGASGGEANDNNVSSSGSEDDGNGNAVVEPTAAASDEGPSVASTAGEGGKERDSVENDRDDRTAAKQKPPADEFDEAVAGGKSETPQKGNSEASGDGSEKHRNDDVSAESGNEGTSAASSSSAQTAVVHQQRAALPSSLLCHLIPTRVGLAEATSTLLFDPPPPPQAFGKKRRIYVPHHQRAPPKLPFLFKIPTESSAAASSFSQSSPPPTYTRLQSMTLLSAASTLHDSPYYQQLACSNNRIHGTIETHRNVLFLQKNGHHRQRQEEDDDAIRHQHSDESVSICRVPSGPLNTTSNSSSGGGNGDERLLALVSIDHQSQPNNERSSLRQLQQAVESTAAQPDRDRKISSDDASDDNAYDAMKRAVTDKIKLFRRYFREAFLEAERWAADEITTGRDDNGDDDDDDPNGPSYLKATCGAWATDEQGEQQPARPSFWSVAAGQCREKEKREVSFQRQRRAAFRGQAHHRPDEQQVDSPVSPPRRSFPKSFYAELLEGVLQSAALDVNIPPKENISVSIDDGENAPQSNPHANSVPPHMPTSSQSHKQQIKRRDALAAVIADHLRGFIKQRIVEEEALKQFNYWRERRGGGVAEKTQAAAGGEGNYVSDFASTTPTATYSLLNPIIRTTATAKTPLPYFHIDFLFIGDSIVRQNVCNYFNTIMSVLSGARSRDKCDGRFIDGNARFRMEGVLPPSISVAELARSHQRGENRTASFSSPSPPSLDDLIAGYFSKTPISVTLTFAIYSSSYFGDDLASRVHFTDGLGIEHLLNRYYGGVEMREKIEGNGKNGVASSFNTRFIPPSLRPPSPAATARNAVPLPSMVYVGRGMWDSLRSAVGAVEERLFMSAEQLVEAAARPNKTQEGAGGTAPRERLPLQHNPTLLRHSLLYERTIAEALVTLSTLFPTAQLVLQGLQHVVPPRNYAVAGFTYCSARFAKGYWRRRVYNAGRLFNGFKQFEQVDGEHEHHHHGDGIGRAGESKESSSFPHRPSDMPPSPRLTYVDFDALSSTLGHAAFTKGDGVHMVHPLLAVMLTLNIIDNGVQRLLAVTDTSSLSFSPPPPQTQRQMEAKEMDERKGGITATAHVRWSHVPRPLAPSQLWRSLHAGPDPLLEGMLLWETSDASRALRRGVGLILLVSTEGGRGGQNDAEGQHQKQQQQQQGLQPPAAAKVCKHSSRAVFMPSPSLYMPRNENTPRFASGLCYAVALTFTREAASRFRHTFVAAQLRIAGGAIPPLSMPAHQLMATENSNFTTASSLLFPTFFSRGFQGGGGGSSSNSTGLHQQPYQNAAAALAEGQHALTTRRRIEAVYSPDIRALFTPLLPHIHSRVAEEKLKTIGGMSTNARGNAKTSALTFDELAEQIAEENRLKGALESSFAHVNQLGLRGLLDVLSVYYHADGRKVGETGRTTGASTTANIAGADLTAAHLDADADQFINTSPSAFTQRALAERFVTAEALMSRLFIPAMMGLYRSGGDGAATGGSENIKSEAATGASSSLLFSCERAPIRLLLKKIENRPNDHPVQFFLDLQTATVLLDEEGYDNSVHSTTSDTPTVGFFEVCYQRFSGNQKRAKKDAWLSSTCHSLADYTDKTAEARLSEELNVPGADLPFVDAILNETAAVDVYLSFSSAQNAGGNKKHGGVAEDEHLRSLTAKRVQFAATAFVAQLERLMLTALTEATTPQMMLPSRGDSAFAERDVESFRLGADRFASIDRRNGAWAGGGSRRISHQNRRTARRKRKK